MKKLFQSMLFCGVFFLLLAGSVRAGVGDTLKVTTWVNDEYTWPVTHQETFSGFPLPGLSVRKAIMRMTLDCASGGCDPWDVTAPFWVRRTLPDGSTEDIEIARYITPYAKTGVWEWDVTDYMPLLRDSVTLRHQNASYTSGPQGYAVTLEFFFIEGTPPREAYAVEKLWQGNYRYGINTVDTSRNLELNTLPNGDTAWTYLWDHYLVVDSVIAFDSTQVGNGSIAVSDPIAGGSADARVQMIWRASELSTAGLTAGDISGIRFAIATAGDDLRQLQIRMRHTNLNSLDSLNYEMDGFTNCYRANTPVSGSGWLQLPFAQPFTWNGTSNIIVDLCYDNHAPGNNTQVLADGMTYNATVYHAANDFYIEIDDTQSVSVPATAFSGLDSAITVTCWQYGTFGVQPQSDYLFEGRDAAGERVVNVHLPWGNGQVYWDAGNDGSSYDRINAQATADQYQAGWHHWAFVKNARTGEMQIWLDGQLFHSGTGTTRDMTGITNFRIGSNSSGGGNYDGMIDDFRVWKSALDSTTIRDFMYRTVDSNHPNWSDLLVNYTFNEGAGNGISDSGPGGHSATLHGPAVWHGHQRIPGCKLHPNQFTGNVRPNVIFEQGNYVSHLDSTLADSMHTYAIIPRPVYNSFDSTVTNWEVNIDTNAAAVGLKIRTTGHGFGGNDNCAEFCPKNHWVTIDGNTAYSWQNWNDDCGMNACFPQGGTWIYNRAGWCPGEDVFTHDLDITSWVSGGGLHTFDYEVDPYNWNGSGSTPTWTMANHLVYFNAANFSLDAEIVDIISPTDKYIWRRFNPTCGEAEIEIRNSGTTPLTSVEVHYRVGGTQDSVFVWTGNLGFLERERIVLGKPDFHSNTATTFEVWLENPNGSTDQHHWNDTMRTHFVRPDTLPPSFIMLYATNNRPIETTFELTDEAGNILAESNPFIAANDFVIDTFYLNQGCYYFHMADIDGDGISFFANNDGSGYLRFNEVNGPVLWAPPGDFGSELNYHFVVAEDYVAREEENLTGFGLFPNPTSGILTIQYAPEKRMPLELEVTNLMGGIMLKKEVPSNSWHRISLDLSGFPSGVYLVKARSPEGELVEKVVKTGVQ